MVHAADRALVFLSRSFGAVSRPVPFTTMNTRSGRWIFVSNKTFVQRVLATASVAFDIRLSSVELRKSLSIQ
jgi:hypothetical protein